jgi:hypothetical protein
MNSILDPYANSPSLGDWSFPSIAPPESVSPGDHWELVGSFSRTTFGEGIHSRFHRARFSMIREEIARGTFETRERVDGLVDRLFALIT